MGSDTVGPIAGHAVRYAKHIFVHQNPNMATIPSNGMFTHLSVAHERARLRIGARQQYLGLYSKSNAYIHMYAATRSARAPDALYPLDAHARASLNSPAHPFSQRLPVLVRRRRRYTQFIQSKRCALLRRRYGSRISPRVWHIVDHKPVYGTIYSAVATPPPSLRDQHRCT